MPLITDSVGRVLGQRYRLVSALGTGASAHVYLAQDVTLQHDVAVKVLQPGLSRDQAFLKRFGAEARAAASLNHPHVLRVFDWGEDDGPYLVLEFLGGGSLRDLLDRRVRLSHAQAALLGREVADGLAYAHSRGLVHRDIKPANLLFDEEGRVRIADFGVARALAEAAWTEPAGAMIGTARYASPEQAEGRPVDGRADVYSLSLVLYEALTGIVPFSADTTVATLMARVGAPLPWHPALGPLAAVLARAADPDRGRRLDAADLSAELAALSGSLGEAPPLPLAHGVAGSVREPSRNGGTAVAAGVGAVGLGAGVAAGPGEVFDVKALDNHAPYGDTLVHDDHATAVMGATTGAGAAETEVAGAGAATAVVERASGPESPSPATSAAAEPRRHRRRWPLVVALAVVLLGVAVFAAVQTKLFTPSERVPALTGMSLAHARQVLTADHLDLSQGPSVYSLTRPAGDVVRQSPSNGSSLKQGSAVQVTVSKGLPPVPVPSLLQLDCQSAQRLLTDSHLVGLCPAAAAAYSTTVPQGQVINWSYDNKLDAKNAPYGSTILMAISKGLPPVTIPTVTGAASTYQSAAQTLQQAGLTPTQAQQYSTSVPQGQVVGTDPSEGSSVPHGSTVTVIVSEGPPFVTVPDVSGDSLNKAEKALENAGLVIGQVYGPTGGNNVLTTDPAIGSSVQEGTTVDVYTTGGPASAGPGH